LGYGSILDRLPANLASPAHDLKQPLQLIAHWLSARMP
jgi:hypothetical protein